MKNILLLSVLCFLGFTTTLFAQIKLGDNPTVLQPSAVLEMESNTKGMLMPRMTAAQKEAIVAPASGLTIYQTDGDTGFWYYDGTQWRKASLPSGTQTGDMLYWNGSTWMLLPSGQQGQPLVYCNGVPQWGACVPTVTTLAALNIGIEQANLSGVINFDGGSIVLTRGFCWSTNPNPTTANNNTPVPGILANFQIDINTLSANTIYYVRAYAENSAGLMYGNEISFTTLPAIIATGLSATVSNIGSVTAQFQGSVVFDGGSTITERGICWSLNSTPTTNDQVINTGSGEGAFSGSISGLTLGTVYYVRPYAVNGVGTAYGPELSFTTLDYPTVATTTPSNITQTSARIGGTLTGNGGSPLTELGVCWGTNPSPSTADNKVNSGNFNNGTYTFDLTSLVPATTYYVRAFAINAVGTVYGAEESFTTLPPQLPSISTTALSNITANTAQSGGNVTANGGTAVTARGVCWSTSPNPTIADAKTLDSLGTGVFSSSITGLNQNTTYYVRAYATNSVGTVYGGEEVVNTLTLATLTTIAPSDITSTSFTTGGIISNTGGNPILEKGFCWDTVPNPTTNDWRYNFTYPQNGSIFYGNTNENIFPNKLYYLKAYVRTVAGIAYGQEFQFVTQNATIPTVQSIAIANSGPTGGYFVYNILSEGNAQILESGICWSLISMPTLADSKSSELSGSVGQRQKNLNGLSPATLYYVRPFVRNIMGVAYGDELTLTTTGLPPNLNTLIITGITTSGFTSGGEITTNGGAPITSKGLCWNLYGGPSVDDDKLESGSGDSSFISIVTGLQPNQIYHVRAYATNNGATSYGSERIVTTLSVPPVIPIVTTNPVANITAASADGYGDVTFDGGAAIITRGICWSSSLNPTINDSKSENNGGIGSYSESITGLTAGTTYYVRAFATNSVGTAYGNEVSFTTLNLPILSTSIVYNVLATTASTGGTVASNGGNNITSRGICWSTNPNPTINNSTQNAGSGLGSFTADLSNLSPNTTYYVRAFATTAAGTAYGNEVSFLTLVPSIPLVNTTYLENIYSNYIRGNGIITNIGNAQIIESGFCWNTSPNPTVSNFKTITGASIGNYNGGLYPLQPATTYYIRAYANNVAGTGYGTELTATTLGDAPTLSTINPSNITSTAAICGGTIINNGGIPLTEKGVCWSSNDIPYIWNAHTNDGPGDAPFTSTLTNLAPGTTYFVRAYGKSNGQYGYGNLQTITTQVAAPVLNTTAPFNITQTTANSGGEIQSAGGLPIYERGVCWSTSPSPTVNDNKTMEGPGNSNFTSNITGLTLGITYYVRAYATNAIGTAYGNEIYFQTLLPASLTTNLVTNLTATNANSGGVITSDGGNPVTDRGVCWSTSPNPTYNGSARTYEGSGTGPFSSALSNLQPGTTYYVRAFGITAAGPGYGQEETFTTTIPVLPTVSTEPMGYIGSYAANGSGFILNDGGAAITQRGLCWSIAPNPTVNNYVSFTDQGTGQFGRTLYNLSAGTTYHVRAFAISIAGTSYGNDITFNTLGAAPTLTTNVISSIAATMAISGGVITNNGGAEISSKGVIWSSSNVPYIGSYQGITNDGIGSAPFTSNLSNLSPGTTYYVRSYATNNGETGYGSLYTFTTTYNVPSVATSLVSNIDQTSANGGGNVTNNGGQNVTERGVCWSTSPSPTINDNKLAIGAGNGGFSGSMTGLALGVTYYVRAYATNSVGTGYGAQVSFTTAVTYATVSTDPITNITATTATGGGNVSSQGGSAITARGVCWSVNPNPTLFNSKTINGSGTGTFSSNLSNLLPGKTYYVRAYASNSAGTAYGQQESFTTTTTLPTLNGKPVIYITLNSAQSGGNISNDGGANVTERGVCWSTSPNPTTSNSKTVDGTGSGDFTSTPTGLSPLTTYYLRAYATNNVGTAYGSEIVFQTTNFPVAIGQAYQGGIICYIDGSGEHGLIVSNGDIGYAPYGCAGTVTGAIGTAIGTGVVNTGTILQSCNETNTAAKICDDFSVIDGGVIYDDWFLPSIDEAITIYTNLFLNNLGGFSNSNAGYDISSSTEYSSTDYLYYGFYSSNNYSYNWTNTRWKTNDLPVRAMRTF